MDLQETIEVTAHAVERTRGWLFKSRIKVMLAMVMWLAIAAALFFWFFCITTIDSHELGFTFDRWSGEIQVVEKKGWVIRNPFQYAVHQLDLRPYQITISANERVLNAKLVRFKPDGLETFVAWHGRSAGDDLEALKEILKCYAFAVDGGESCPFIEVVQQIEPGQAGGDVPIKLSSQ